MTARAKAGDALKATLDANDKRRGAYTNARANARAAEGLVYGGEWTKEENEALQRRLRAESSIAREALGGAA